MFSWVISGVIIGIIVYKLQPHARGGFVGSLLMGLLGAMEGGFFSQFLFQRLGDFHPALILCQILGACFILGTQRVLSQLPQRSA